MELQSSMPRILVYQVADSTILEDYLKFYGYSVISTTSETVKKQIMEKNYDLCIIDHYNDLELLDFIRKVDKKVSVIVVSSYCDNDHIVKALNAGADDYLSIPYNLEELVARIKSIMRRVGLMSRGVQDFYQIGDYTLDVKNEILSIRRVPYKLTPRESHILSLLCAYKNEVLSRKIILEQVWKDDSYWNRRSLDVHVFNLRSYLKQDERIEIKTVRGLGYTLSIKGEDKAEWYNDLM